MMRVLFVNTYYVAATSPNNVWTYDFMFDATYGGRRMKVLTVIDEFTRKPWQNGFAESFNSRVRDECLNMNEFWSIEHARVVLEGWRIELNTEHPHSSLGYMTPEQFAASWGAA